MAFGIKSLIYPFIILFFILLYCSTLQSKEVYKWRDQDGVIHITENADEIPEKYRKNSEIIELEDRGIKTNIIKHIATLKNYKELIVLFLSAIVIFFLFYKIYTFTRKKIEENYEKKRQDTLKQRNVDEMDRNTFKKFIMQVLEKSGYKIQIVSTPLDFGIDFIASRNFDHYAVRTINNIKNEISRITVMDINREKHRFDSNKSMVVSNSYFDDQAIELAKDVDCEIIDRDKLSKLIYDYT